MDLPAEEIVQLRTGPARVLWRRSARARRVSLRVDPTEGHVVVTLPPRGGAKTAMELLRDNAGWVALRLSEVPAAAPFADGATVPICDVPHRIRHRPDARGAAWIEDGELHVAGEAAFLPRRVGDFLRAEAGWRIAAIVRAKAALIGASPKRVAIKDTSSRWGSCAPDGTLAFSWRLVMAPEAVQDYVVSHEVAHLRHMNHGPRFWALTESLTPHRALATAWLNREGARLQRVGRGG